jgi:hypothetical protein
MAKQGPDSSGFNSTSEQRQRDLDSDAYAEGTPDRSEPSNEGGKVIHVDPEDSRPVTVTVPSEEAADHPLDRDGGSEFLF